MRSVAAAILAAVFAVSAHAEAIKIGILKTTTSGPVYIAQDKGFFAAEQLQSELVVFESAQPVAVATASGDIDFGYTGFTGGFYGLASQGVLRVVGGGAGEVPGYPNEPFLVSHKAWDAGLKSFKDFPGHSFGLSQFGSPPHYALGVVAEKYGFDIKTVRLVPLNSLPNMVSAVTSGQIDLTVVTGSLGAAVLGRGDARLLGYVGDEAPFQLGAVIASRKTADERGDTVRRFLHALQKGSRAYHDAFTKDGKRADGPDAPAMIAIIARNTGQPESEVARSLPYVDAEARLDVADVTRQYEWYKAQGMLKGAAQSSDMIDRRYVVDLTKR
ncbi:MAG TPA: ABC transporter substrate-binding protein [Stellaceae bacterium]|nr:ABC transporter substrate-binding protein [Stellaceae bacterium]